MDTWLPNEGQGIVGVRIYRKLSEWRNPRCCDGTREIADTPQEVEAMKGLFTVTFAG